MKDAQEQLFAESTAWIRENPRATNHDVPDRLLLGWCYNNTDEELAPSGFYFSVFTFGYCQRQLLDTAAKPNQKMSVPADKLIALFQRWQLKLGLAEAHRKTDLRVASMDLWAFPEKEEIRYWREAAD